MCVLGIVFTASDDVHRRREVTQSGVTRVNDFRRICAAVETALSFEQLVTVVEVSVKAVRVNGSIVMKAVSL